MNKRPRDDDQQAPGAIEQSYQQLQQQPHADAQLASFAPAGSELSHDVVLLPSEASGAPVAAAPASTTAAKRPGGKKAKLDAAGLASGAVVAQLVSQPPSGPGSSAAAAAAPASPAVGKKHDVHRAEYLAKMDTFWEDQLAATQRQLNMQLNLVPPNSAAAKPALPLARIKKLMKADDDVRSTVMRSDVADAIATGEQFDFLLDVIPRDETAVQQQIVPISASTVLASFEKSQQQQAAQQQQQLPPPPPQPAQAQQLQPLPPQHMYGGVAATPAQVQQAQQAQAQARYSQYIAQQQQQQQQALAAQGQYAQPAFTGRVL